MKKHIFQILLFCVVSISTFAQRWEGNQWGGNWGIQVGMSVELGTHIKRVGLKLQGFVNYKFVQINAGDHIRFNVESWGERKNFTTHRVNLGGALMVGKQHAQPHFILDGLHHQTAYNYGLAYNFLWYIDNMGSSQESGGFGLHIKQLSFLIENDLFAGHGIDRFRTSYAGISYHNGPFNLTLNTALWTGETGWTKLQNTPDNKYQLGYKDLSKNKYGRTSHGILSVSMDYLTFFGNTVSTAIGVDSEYVRHALQNKLIHDKVFVPKKIRKPNAHYPMLDRNGLPVIIDSGGIVAPAKFYFQMAINRNLTY